MLIKHILIFHTILTFIIVLLPNHRPRSNEFFQSTNLVIKKYAFFLTLMIRVSYIRKWDKILAEYLLYFVSVKSGGTLRAASYICQNGFNTSGHLFLFSYSCYLFMASILIRKSFMNVICSIGFVSYTILGIRTVIYYHKKTECLVSAVNSLAVCLIHDLLINST